MGRRPAAPGPDWTWAKTSAEALAALRDGPVEEISLDHDLDGGDTTRPLALWICENEVWPDRIAVHSGTASGNRADQQPWT